MTEAVGPMPAQTLPVTKLPDGAALLELLADWYTVLATAGCDVQDTAGIARILTSRFFDLP